VERGLLREALRRSGGNQSQAARLLGISRQTLIYRIKKFGLEAP
jgi:two-component system NtrC family response regulator